MREHNSRLFAGLRKCPLSFARICTFALIDVGWFLNCEKREPARIGISSAKQMLRWEPSSHCATRETMAFQFSPAPVRNLYFSDRDSASGRRINSASVLFRSMKRRRTDSLELLKILSALSANLQSRTLSYTSLYWYSLLVINFIIFFQARSKE